MGAPGTTLEGAEKPVIRAVVRLMREAVEASSVKKRIVADVVSFVAMVGQVDGRTVVLSSWWFGVNIWGDQSL